MGVVLQSRVCKENSAIYKIEKILKEEGVLPSIVFYLGMELIEQIEKDDEDKANSFFCKMISKQYHLTNDEYCSNPSTATNSMINIPIKIFQYFERRGSDIIKMGNTEKTFFTMLKNELTRYSSSYSTSNVSKIFDILLINYKLSYNTIDIFIKGLDINNLESVNKLLQTKLT